MVIEIFGFAISDIAAIGALIASALIFLFGYTRTRKSEQITIARNLMDRIGRKVQKLERIHLDQIIRGPVEHTQVSEAKAIEVLTEIHYLEEDIRYFRYLLNIHEIRDKNLLRYYIPLTLHPGFATVAELLGELKTRGIDMSDPPSLEYQFQVLEGVKQSMKPWLDKYASAPPIFFPGKEPPRN